MAETPDSVGAIVKRAEKAWADKTNFDTLVREMYRYALPQRDRWETETAGESRTDLVFDSTAVKSVKKYAGRIVTDVFPAGRDWALLEPGPGIKNENKERAKKDLQDATDIAFSIIHNATNFNCAIGEWALDLATGTAAMLVLKGPSIANPIIFQAMPILSIAIDEGPAGSVGGIFRKPRVKNRNLKGEWPDIKMDSDMEDLIANTPDAYCDGLWECTYHDIEKDEWCYEVYRKKGNKKLVERKFKSNPWVIVRLNKAAKEVNGRGPLADALPDIKTINKMVELVLRNAALAVSGVWTGVDDGVMNPDTVRITAGSVISVSRNQGHPAGPSLAPLERPGDFDVAQLEHERLSMSIKQCLLDESLPPMTGAVRSATEIVERIKELAQDMGANFGRLIVEGVVPIMQRVIDILSEWALINMQGVKIGGAAVKLTVTSPLAQIQNLDDIEKIVKTIELSYALVGKELTMRVIKVEEVVGRIAEKLGFPADLVRDETERGELDQMVAQMLASLQKEEGAGAVAEQMKGVGQPVMAGQAA